MKDCSHKPNLVVVPNDSINSIIDDKQAVIDMLVENNKAIRLQIDSLKEVKPKVIVRYKTVYDSLLIVDTMCVQALNTLHNEHSKVDSVNNSIISNQETHIMNDSQIIGNLSEIVYLQKLQHIKDSTRNKQLTDTIPTVKRKGFLKGFGVGFGSGAAVSKGADVLINLNR